MKTSRCEKVGISMEKVTHVIRAKIVKTPVSQLYTKPGVYSIVNKLVPYIKYTILRFVFILKILLIN